MTGIIACTALLLVIRTLLRRTGFGRTYRTVSRFAVPARNGATQEQPSDIASSVVRRVTVAAAFYPGRARCLEQSLLVYLLLRRRGIAADLRLGTNSFGRGAHAWVEVDGRPVNEPADLIKKMVVFPALPV